MTNEPKRTCPLCGGHPTQFWSSEGRLFGFHKQACQACRLPCRHWDQVQQLQRQVDRLQADADARKAVIDEALCQKIDRLQAIIRFARDKCVCPDAGNLFAYVCQADWEEFERMAADAAEGE